MDFFDELIIPLLVVLVTPIFVLFVKVHNLKKEIKALKGDRAIKRGAAVEEPSKVHKEVPVHASPPRMEHKEPSYFSLFVH